MSAGTEGRQIGRPKKQKLAEAVVSGGVNQVSGNGADHPELYALLQALQAMRAGDFSIRMGSHYDGLAGKIAETFNDIVAANQRMAKELERAGAVVGREGKTRHRIKLGGSSGAWGEMESSINTLIDDLLWPTSEVTRAIAAVAQGDLLESVRLDG